MHTPDKIESRKVSDLRPSPNNARTHSAEQVQQIGASIKRFGFTAPVLIDGSGTIIAGHGRVMAAQAIGMTEVPCIELTHLTPDEQRAYMLADNQLALNAGWDPDILAAEIAAIDLSGVDVELTGFGEAEIAELLGKGSELESSAGAGSEEVEAMLDAAWQTVAADWTAHCDRAAAGGLLSPNVTPGIAAVNFIQAKYCGGTYSGMMSLAFVPQRFWTNGEARSLPDGIVRAINNKSQRDALRWRCGEKQWFSTLLAGPLPMCGSRMPLDFPADLARDLIDEFTPQGGRVLDPCHGWGGRYVGFLLSSRAAEYVGCDPSPHAHAGLERTRDALARFAEPHKVAEFIEQPFEDAAPSGLFDFALTSPPYFNVEKYSGDLTSTTRYPAFATWTQGFYLPMLRKVAALLKSDAVFALQVGDQKYPLGAIAIEHASSCGFEFVGKRRGVMKNSFSQTPDDTAEAVLVLRKV